MEAVMITGGKDSVVMLHMLNINKEMLFFKIYTQKIKSAKIECTLNEIELKWNIKIIRIYGNNIKECTESIINIYNIKKFYLGVRKDDNKNYKKWNDIEIVYPIFDLNYNDVWKIILDNKLPYCKLYLEGYSSLGETELDSTINFNLQNTNNTYIPAWDLKEISSERTSRINIIEGIVYKDKQLGRTLGFPTANIKIEQNIESGIYYTKCEYNNFIYNSMTYIGNRPSINTSENIICETNIFDFDKEIYDKKIKLYFIKKIRDDIKYNSIDELKEAINNDKKNIIDYIKSTSAVAQRTP